MTDNLRVELRPPTEADLARGRGVPSGPGGQWRVVTLYGAAPLIVYYGDGNSARVQSLRDWHATPAHGVQAVVGAGVVAKNADEYRWGSFPVAKYGEMVDDAAYQRVIERALRG